MVGEGDAEMTTLWLALRQALVLEHSVRLQQKDLKGHNKHIRRHLPHLETNLSRT